MRRTFAVFAAAALSISVFSSTSFAAGFSLPDQDAAAMGMANAFTGQADNPAGQYGTTPRASPNSTGLIFQAASSPSIPF